ncbi:LLM class flavin-dependent oxidoreductase [Actinacidiphila oryziradicis]|uniref:LLM class flavin-dependent oxidoreductase n=1 Tax=Actinacidiphila oryziradicis TaxID=2571141 RepID=A0A4U0RQJ1_9ACTN|nr:LLM class flavin-dependent oxidoreductase [Actinacidiphila oryziradicis]TJZ98251.1 LLM class flavin-dependent oxidoreductase [Actinacidiphila oryziradicis]
MTVEFISLINVWESSELFPKPGGTPDADYVRKYARYLEDGGFDYTLVAYNSAGYDPFTVSATIAAHTERIKPIVALRPNTLYPTVAAQSLATLDRLSGGRATVHIISGGSDQEQARHGDYTTKDERYDRSEEYVKLLRRAWTETEPWDHDGTYYKFENFVAGFRPVNGTIPVSVGGSSAAAYRVGGALGDIFGLWGEPLAETREQIDKVAEQARLAGRTDTPRTWVTFRPIVAPTDELAWEKAHRTIGIVEQTHRAGRFIPSRLAPADPQNVGSQRALEIAQRGDVHDRALWTVPSKVTNAAGASSALVGSYETVAAAILDYVDLGAELVSIRGYDNLNDAIDYGRYILPLVRQELAHRAATGERGTVVAQPPLDGASVDARARAAAPHSTAGPAPTARKAS